MSNLSSVRIPAGKLGTLRVDRTVDVYPIPSVSEEIVFNAKTYIPTLTVQRQLTTFPSPFIIENLLEQRCFIPRIIWNHSIDGNQNDDDDDEDVSDIAVIYSVVRRASTRRTSSPGLSVLPLSPNFNIPQAQIVKSYTLEPPLIPTVTHVSRQAQIKILTPTRPNTISTPTPSRLVPPIRIQTSTSFTSHDRPYVPVIPIKPRPISFRNVGRRVLERRISNITERVSQLQETFFSRLTHAPAQKRNRSLSNFHTTTPSTIEYNLLKPPIGRPRPKSENYDDRHRVNSGKTLSRSQKKIYEQRSCFVSYSSCYFDIHFTIPLSFFCLLSLVC